MGAGGRPALPTEVKAAKGTLRKHREAGKGPDAPPLTEVPPAPPRFDGRDHAVPANPSPDLLTRIERGNQQRRLARETWETLAAVLVERKVLTKSDLLALELCCWEYARWRMLAGVIEDEGSTVAQCNGEGDVLSVVSHPAVGQMDRAQANTERLLVQLGLTPAARTRVRGSAVTEEEENPIKNLIEMRRGPQGVVSGGRPPAEG